MSDDNAILLAVAAECWPCSSWSISPANQATAAAIDRWDRQMDGHCSVTQTLPHTMQAVSIITNLRHIVVFWSTCCQRCYSTTVLLVLDHASTTTTIQRVRHGLHHGPGSPEARQSTDLTLVGLCIHHVALHLSGRHQLPQFLLIDPRDQVAHWVTGQVISGGRRRCGARGSHGCRGSTPMVSLGPRHSGLGLCRRRTLRWTGRRQNGISILSVLHSTHRRDTPLLSSQGLPLLSWEDKTVLQPLPVSGQRVLASTNS